jgi:prepilin-type N-terminal cleavage/methylation domain-containing protein
MPPGPHMAGAIARVCARRGIRRAGGFSLIEVLLALALLASLLVALNFFIFSMGEIWGQNRERRLFDQHVRAVTRYVEDLLRRGAMSAGPASPGLQTTEILSEHGTVPLLTFELPAGDRVLPWPGDPLPDVRCSLAADAGRGLLVYWQSRWEIGFDREPPRAVVVSPLVTSIGYDYYNREFQAWQNHETPVRDPTGKYEVPTRLRLHFAHGAYAADAVVNVPSTAPGAF